MVRVLHNDFIGCPAPDAAQGKAVHRMGDAGVDLQPGQRGLDAQDMANSRKVPAPIKNEEILALSFTLPAMNKAIGTPIERTTEQITPAIARPDIVFNSIFISP